MREKINKNLYRALIILSFLALNGLIIFGISSVLGFLNTGAERSTMLHTEIKGTRMYLPKIIWDTTNVEGRPIEKERLQEIERDYLNAWYVKQVALSTNKDDGIADYYTDSARVNLFKNLKFNKKEKLHFKSTSVEHHPKLEFYSADGQFIMFTDKNVVEYRHSFLDEQSIATVTDTATYKVIMLLEDGFWRIRHQVRIAPENVEVVKKAQLNWKVENKQLLYNGNPFNIKGINYYPQATAWDLFGEDFDSDILASDFTIIKNAGLNTLRIFVPYDDFGKADVKEEKLKKLLILMDLAEKLDLKVVVCLFDFYGDYDVLNWTLTHEHARQIVTALKDKKALLAYDLKNEPDLDFDSRGAKNVIDWLSNLNKIIKKEDPAHLVTVGWSDPSKAEILQEELDLISFHYYRSPEEFKEAYSKLKTEINKPMILGEFGRSSYSGIWNPLGYSLDEQAEYYKTMQAFLSKEKLAFMSWTLYDFNEVPSNVVGILPWRKARQKHFGFLDASGKEKPAFKHISN